MPKPATRATSRYAQDAITLLGHSIRIASGASSGQVDASARGRARAPQRGGQ